jgi:quinol monooxygenase YgiN
MHDEISWQVQLAIEPARFDSFRALTNEMIESTRLEEGVLIYERFLSEDGWKVLVYELYANSEAAILHLRSFQEKFADAFGRLVKRDRFLVFGAPNGRLLDARGSLGLRLHRYSVIGASRAPRRKRQSRNAASI